MNRDEPDLYNKQDEPQRHDEAVQMEKRGQTGKSKCIPQVVRPRETREEERDRRRSDQEVEPIVSSVAISG
jgi:hypothetical protein